MGFFRRVEDPNEFKHDVALIYDLVVAMLGKAIPITLLAFVAISLTMTAFMKWGVRPDQLRLSPR